MHFRSTLVAGVAILVMNTTAGSSAGVGSAVRELTPKMSSAASVGILHQIAERRKLKRRHARRGASNAFGKRRGGGVKDTCPGGDNACIKELKVNCDKAGGGLSTEPDGGVDCYVVGIHDQ